MIEVSYLAVACFLLKSSFQSTQSSTSKLLDQNSTINSQTAVATNEQGERDPSELSFDADGKSTTETVNWMSFVTDTITELNVSIYRIQLKVRERRMNRRN